MKDVAELLAPYPLLTLAQASDNAEILDFLDRIDMKTARGGIKFSRRPDFFALQAAQAETALTFLMKNPDGELTGTAVYAITPMRVRGHEEKVAYTCDLRLSPRINRRTRLQFRDIYVDATRHAHTIAEFGGARTIITSIFDENAAAISTLVGKKEGRARDMVYRPVFPYHNITVLGRLPLSRALVTHRVERCPTALVNQLLAFLDSNPEQSELTFSMRELWRRQSVIGFRWEDFLVVLDQNGEIQAAGLPVSDEKFRKLVLQGLGAGLRTAGELLPLLGRPALREGEPLRTAYLGFLKIRARSPQEHEDLLASLLHRYLDLEREKPIGERYHNIVVMEPQARHLDQRLRLKGLITMSLPATVYQVVHRANHQKRYLLRKRPHQRMDFEVGFA